MAEKRVRGKNKEKEELIAEYEKKIKYHQDCIESLKVKIENVKNPKPNAKQQLKEIMAKAEENGLTPEQIAEKLGISL